MSTPPEPNPGHTGSGSQATQAKPVTTERELKDLSMRELPQFEKMSELLQWVEENRPEQYEKLLPSRAKEKETINAYTNNPPSHARTASQTSAVLRALQKDWNNAYFPDSLVALRDVVRRYQLLDVNQYYAKTLIFVQSSGMGKSRLADAFGQFCPMINFVLREPGTSGFPPPDEEILSFLREKPPADITGPTSLQGTSKRTSSDFLKRRAAVMWNHTLATALLQASFETFITWVESKPFTTMTLQELAGSWHAEMAPLEPDDDAKDSKSQRSKMRIEFCDSVAERARVIAKELISNLDWVKKFDDDRPSKVYHELEMVHCEQRPNPLNGLLNATGNLMKILERCQDARNTDSLLVIVFDEASSLMRMSSSDEPHTGLYVALNRVISCLKKFRAWSFFLSTESLIGHLVPPSNAMRTGDYLRDSSARISFKEASIELKRFSPFVSLQLDIEDRRRMQDPILSEEELLKPLKTFAKLEHMALFGRPLWYAYTHEPQDMIKLAKLKLIGGQQWANYDPANPDHVFAALSFRLSLDVCLQNPSTISLTRTAVNSFMRVAIFMDHETGVIDATTPSEPILARAAMELLYNNWSSSIQTLSQELLEKGLIEKGRKGELYARLVLILAHDWVRWAQSLRSNPVPVLAPTFMVSDFLMALYARDHHDSLRKIPKRIQEAKMNFTHFVPAHERLTGEVIPELCHDLLRRSAAMQLSWHQETYDLLIPVYYGMEDEKFDTSNCGVILVQVKNQKDATTPREIFQEDFIKVSQETSNPAKLKARSSERKPTKFVFNEMANPILFLLFDLGVVRSSQAYAPLVQVMHSESGLQPDLWAIHSRGYNDTIFGCLQHMDATGPSERFFASVQIGDTLADRLSLRNRTFYQLRRGFRYEGFDQKEKARAGGSEARVQEEDIGETGKESGVVNTGAQEGEASSTGSKGKEVDVSEARTEGGVDNTGAQEGEASNTGSKEKEVESPKNKRFGQRARDFTKSHLTFRRRRDRTG